MKRNGFFTHLTIFLFSFLFIFPKITFAQGQIFCSASFGNCSMSANSCSLGYTPPSYPGSTGDPCYNYYFANNDCPISIDCVLPPTPTPTPPTGSSPTPTPPIPTQAPFSCPGPYGTYCDDVTHTLSCPTGYFCNSSNVPPSLPQFCSGICVSLTPIPTVGPVVLPTGNAYDPRCGPDSDRNSAVKTALGCLPTSPQAFVDIAIPWAIGLGSGVAFLLGLYGVLMIVISAGNPEKMQAGRELITSAITGLLIIIFAVFILKVVGVDILKLFFWKEQQVWQ